MSIERGNDLLLFGLTIDQLASKIVNRDKKLKNKFALWLQERLNFETSIKKLVEDMEKFDKTLKLKTDYTENDYTDKMSVYKVSKNFNPSLGCSGQVLIRDDDGVMRWVDKDDVKPIGDSN